MSRVQVGARYRTYRGTVKGPYQVLAAIGIQQARLGLPERGLLCRQGSRRGGQAGDRNMGRRWSVHPPWAGPWGVWSRPCAWACTNHDVQMVACAGLHAHAHDLAATPRYATKAPPMASTTAAATIPNT